MNPKYKVGDFLFYRDRWGIMLIEITDIDITKGRYITLTNRNELGSITVPYEFNILDTSENTRLATKAERILLCK